MPTARELLEQADALMRRQREPVEVRGARQYDESPTQGPPTDSTLGAPAAVAPEPGPETEPRVDAAPASPADLQQTLARMPSATGALASMRWSAPAPAPVANTTSPVFAAPPSNSPRTIQREPIAPSSGRVPLPFDGLAVPPAPATRPVDEDIPLLTDAVPDDELARAAREADVPLLTEAVLPMDEEPILEDAEEPSIWDPLAGGPPSISGRGPESTAVVPPPEPAPSVDPLGLDRPAPGFAPPPSVRWAGDEAPPAEPTAVEDTPAEASSAGVAPPEGAAPAVPEAEPVADAAAATLALPTRASASPLAPLDDARVREIAEEIGMQVLQRIDIFTDTELRGRLGERLKPVVERVSAELVGAINQHVGELLRAYVAEAIEREIDGWRDRQP